MKILLSAIPFDNGKSGISVYIREVVKASTDTAVYTPSGEKGWDTAYETFKKAC